MAYMIMNAASLRKLRKFRQACLRFSFEVFLVLRFFGVLCRSMHANPKRNTLKKPKPDLVSVTGPGRGISISKSLIKLFILIVFDD